MRKPLYRVGQIVPSSNTTMETEVPAMFRAREAIAPERFSFHSSRMRMKQVTRQELAAMDRDSDRCATELSDARVDVMGYACMVAIMSMGKGYHRQCEIRLHRVTAQNGGACPVVTSAGALVNGLQALRANRISLIAPYIKPLTRLVVSYIEAEGFRVQHDVALEIYDNLEVGARDPMALVEIARRVSVKAADVLVLSACVQMPSLQAIQVVEDELGLPVISAAVCTTYQMLRKLGLSTKVPGAGTLLSGKYDDAPTENTSAGDHESVPRFKTEPATSEVAI